MESRCTKLRLTGGSGTTSELFDSEHRPGQCSKPGATVGQGSAGGNCYLQTLSEQLDAICRSKPGATVD